jgi:hypothetical protein
MLSTFHHITIRVVGKKPGDLKYVKTLLKIMYSIIISVNSYHMMILVLGKAARVAKWLDDPWVTGLNPTVGHGYRSFK